MTRIAVPKHCLGFEMQDGTKYNRKAEGFVEVNNDRHLREIERSAAKENHWIGAGGYVFAGRSGQVCLCTRTSWPWETECPRCGRAL